MSLKRYLPVFFFIFIITLNSPFSPAYTYTDKECLECHGKPGIFQITGDGKVRSVFVNSEEWAKDIHYKSKMVCVNCHILANPYLHFREGFIDVDCSRCHPEEAEEYQKNIHYEYEPVAAGKELPSCYHCHTKHSVLRHDDPSSSVHENNVGETCGICHPEVMVKGILAGGSLGKISGHRKGDLSERFDMRVCINCHYRDAAHGAKRLYKDFCSRCHDVRSKAGPVMGPTHLDSRRWSWLNYTGSGLAVFILVGLSVLVGYRSRRGIMRGMKTWLSQMRIKKKEAEEEENSDPHQEDIG